MELKSPDDKKQLDKITHSVRAYQAVVQYGVGAMVDFPDQTLMTAAPEYWQGQIIKIHDERLEKVLHVDYFGIPAGSDDPNGREGISYVRFPEWYFCPKCRKFQPITAWVKEYRKQARQKDIATDPNMVKHMKCPTCKQDLVVTRIITACANGHIDDFPWVKWVHYRNKRGPKEVCGCPSLTFRTTSSSSEGLEGLTVTCKSCNAEATLKGAFDRGALGQLDTKLGRSVFKCTGKHPWKHTQDLCNYYPRVLQRGSSSVYFPIRESSLVIPPYSSLITKKVENSRGFAEFEVSVASLRSSVFIPSELLPSVVQEAIEKGTKEIAREIGIAEEKVREVLERKQRKPEGKEEYLTTSVKYRLEEYLALSGAVTVPLKESGDFLREGTVIADYKIPYVTNISLIHKVREVQALIGFSRIEPAETITSDYAVSVKQRETRWYPAYEVRGEGIFIEFDETAIAEWQKKHPEIQDRVDTLNDNYQKSFIGQSRPREISAKFLLLHTISHSLIKQLSFECGYSIASLKERIYCCDGDADNPEMAGIFIYTASGDSEGTLGGLVRQGRADVFPALFKKAIETAMTCSNDPVCNLSLGQGRESLNLSACYSCSLIPETSCEHFNIFLDRGTIVGTYENREIGFYFDQLYGGKPWSNPNIQPRSKTTVKQNSSKFALTSSGIDLSEISYSEIWSDLKVWTTDVRELTLLSKLSERSANFDQKEKPFQNCKFQINGIPEQYTCDLYWKQSRVALFLEENKESYLAAENSNIRCFLCSDANTSPESILRAIRPR